ncbi:MAG: hypothetical protein CVV64_05290 [Candidatus Wallbacteria bacterium HGW-Wallbacteria-1]|jgi:anti-sigma B factor antagonist|uniref:Anti-sigma factor antagonist n=1 Tax=Candidatus Wallbacteria bacterium HGW-Wallbacteria-1 TaxID=2013854 RepID=A0A2N1PS62_9BACT|nr:MAG: hypothetical protein CVV64_05290 [Candidatus Wallbacteria bacterium HGW-Wallbacteria-1]
MLKIQWNDMERDAVLVELEGSLDFDSELYLKKMLENILSGGKYNLVFDMSRIEYANSYGFNVINNTLARVRKMHGDIRLANVQPNVMMLLQLVGLTKNFNIHKDVEEALESFAVRSDEDGEKQ